MNASQVLRGGLRLNASIYAVLWMFAALLTGILLAWQPIAVTLVLLVAIIAASSLISPVAAVIVLLIFAPLRTLIETEAPGLLPVDIGLLTVAAVAFVWYLVRIARAQPLLRIPRSALWAYTLPFFVVAALTGLSAFSFGAWLNEWLKWAIMLGLALFVLNLKRWEWLVFGVTLAALANAIVGLYIFLGGSGALHLLVEGRFFRAFGTFGQPNPFGGFMGLIAPLAAATAWGYALLTWQTWRRKNRIDTPYAALMIFYATAAALISVGVIISWSRGAWLGFGVSMMLMLISLPRQRRISVAMLALIGFGAVIVLTTDLLPMSITSRITSATEELFNVQDVRGVDITAQNYAVVERLAHWQAALNMASAHPWLGVGFGNYEIAYDQYRILNWREPLGHAHNYYLNVLAETGIIGLLCYMVLWTGILWITWRARQHPDPLARAVTVGLLGTWLYLLLHSLTDNLYVNNLFLHLGILLGVVALLHSQINQSVRVKRP